MNIAKAVLFIVIVAFSVYSQKVTVTTDSLIYKFISSYREGCYRSGFLKKDFVEWTKAASLDNLPVKYEDNEQPIKSFYKWTNKLDYEYSINWVEMDSSFLKLITKKKQPISIAFSENEAFLNYMNEYTQYLFDFKAGNFKALTEQELIKKAQNVTEDLLSAFKGRIEINSNNVSFVSESPYTVDVVYRRIFRHGLLPYSVSHILVTVDVAGRIHSLRIKWPLFDKIQQSNETIYFSKALSLAQNDYANSLEAEKDDETFRCLNATIKGMACAWKYINLNGSEFITPCYSFHATMKLDNNDSMLYRIEIPRLAKYILK